MAREKASDNDNPAGGVVVWAARPTPSAPTATAAARSPRIADVFNGTNEAYRKL